ncbi:hypothetical protein [Sphingobium sp. EP60837]|uniref:Uncharacterized protein n=2 Tax=Sphingobium tyrosinilyticum TaxID=2715436 RepID=A0ABV9F5H4_9SPHN|nr:hypothetical protein [Sphingobium sp. EP60837]
MIDLSPQPQDKSSGPTELQPRHDPAIIAPVKTSQSRGWWPLTHDEAENGIELLSRWAGPAVLLIVLALISWWFID